MIFAVFDVWVADSRCWLARTPSFCVFMLLFWWRCIYAACGGSLTAEHGQFTSPRYPDAYISNVECVWNIDISPGNRIMISFRYYSCSTSTSTSTSSSRPSTSTSTSSSSSSRPSSCSCACIFSLLILFR